MPDREKVIERLEYCAETRDCYVRDCVNDAVAMLKEQEPVAVHDPGAYCPKCGWMLYPNDHPHHCGNCGQAVKWE